GSELRAVGTLRGRNKRGVRAGHGSPSGRTRRVYGAAAGPAPQRPRAQEWEDSTVTFPSIDSQRAAVRSLAIAAPRRYRILFVGRASEGPTDIVAALHRALEALGHTVFVPDTEKHPTVLHNPTGASGGLGPVYLKVSELGAILDTFRPQVLVTCAGGLVLDEPGAEELRARGIMSLGMTLSDPDAQSSLVEHVGRFDFHTTNSRLAAARYEEAGV